MTNIQNPFTNTRIEFHILQSFPVTCLNRDDVGSPKSAVVGGVNRARVSSQCWKRQVRLMMKDLGVHTAVRSKLVNKQIADKCHKLGATEEQAVACGDAIAKAIVKDTLYFFTDSEVEAFAKYAQSEGFDASKISDKKVIKLAKSELKLAVDGLDIALFGRMVAQAPELNIEAAAAFSHAISTHAVTNELEFFTALDDLDTNAGHLDNLEFSSATYYRYVSLDLGQLYESLQGQAMAESVEAFTKALFLAIPAARQATMSGACGWDYAKVLVRQGQRVQLSFDKPVRSKGGFLEPSIDALRSELNKKETLFGSLFGKKLEFELGGDTGHSIDQLIERLTATIGEIHG